MLRGHLSGPSTSHRRPYRARKMVANVKYQLRRSSRTRSRYLLFLVILPGLLFLYFWRHNVSEFHRTASSLSPYIPIQISAAFAHDQEFENSRWDDSQDSNLNQHNVAVKHPTFQLLIPASKPTMKLCKTLLSAAILKFPPPTLLGYGQEGDRDRPGADVVRNAIKFLGANDVQKDDIVLIADEDTQFHLPVEVLINRFFHTIRESTHALLRQYGRYPGNFTTLPSRRPQRYYTHILFGAQKNCTSSPSSPACYFAPTSPLPPYDPYKKRESEYKPPKYLAASMLMGTAGHVQSLYGYANELLETDMQRNGSQEIFSQIFGAQEYRRGLYHQSTLSFITRVSQWIGANFFVSKNQPHLLDASSVSHISNSSEQSHCEFGIALDYTSSLFQMIDGPFKSDIKLVRFANISESLHMPRKVMKKIHIPDDLNATVPPFCLQSPSPEPLTALDTLPQSTSWSDIALATNMLTPDSPIVPSALHLPSETNDLAQLWYNPYARALLRQSFRVPSIPINITIPSPLLLRPTKSKSLQQSPRDVSYTDVRGGRGGVWTDKGQWIEWNEVCGAFDEELFGDGKGIFGHEDDGTSEGKTKAVYNSFGQLIAMKKIPAEVKKEKWSQGL